jgi:hypothetical protein
MAAPIQSILTFMKTVSINVYNFSELSDKAKQNAMSNLMPEDASWAEYIEDDMKEIEVELTAWDIERGNYVTLKITDSHRTADLILKSHGKDCGTYRVATTFVREWSELVARFSDGVNTDVVAEENEREFDRQADELEYEFKADLQNLTLKSLHDEWVNVTSESYIAELAEINEYEFDADGNFAKY